MNLSETKLLIQSLIEKCKNDDPESIEPLEAAYRDIDRFSDKDFLSYQMLLCDEFFDEIGEDESFSLYSDALREVESKYPDDIDSCYCNYGYGLFLNRHDKYPEAVLQFQKTLNLYNKLNQKDVLFEAEIKSRLAAAMYDKSLFSNSSYMSDFDACRMLFEESLSLFDSYQGPETEDTEYERNDTEDELTDVYELLCKHNYISRDWASKALELIDKKIKSNEFYDPQSSCNSVPGDSCIEIHEIKCKLLDVLGEEEEYDKCMSLVNEMKEKRSDYYRKRKEEYLANLVYSDSFKEIKERGYIISGESLDCPENGHFGDQMRDLFGENWHCQRFYSSKKSNFEYEVFCYEGPQDFTLTEDGATLTENELNYYSDASARLNSSKNVAVFTGYDAERNGKPFYGNAKFLGLFSCKAEHGVLVFTLVNKKLNLPV